MFGNNEDEIRENVKIIDVFAKKVAKFFRIAFMIMSVFEAIILFNVGNFSTVGNFFLAVIFAALALLSSYFVMYGIGYVWGWGFTMIKYWLIKNKIRKRDIALAAGATVGISYIIGGRRAVKCSLIIMLVILFVSVAIGGYVGLYKYLKMRHYLNDEPVVALNN